AGDAIADPLTGIMAALAAWRGWCCGGGRLLSLALAEVAACSLREEQERLGAAEVQRRFGDWWQAAQAGDATRNLRDRPILEPVGALGEHTAQVLAELGVEC